MKEHAWKACVRETVSRVRIPHSPSGYQAETDAELLLFQLDFLYYTLNNTERKAISFYMIYITEGTAKMEIKLVLPSIDYKEKLLRYKADFIKNGDSMDGSAGLEDALTFEEWYAVWKDNLSESTVRDGLVPATTFLAVDENDDLVGMIDIRHRLSDYLMNFGGHIGYSVIKSQRQKGIATKMLALALEQCRELGIFKVLVTCDKQNIASAKTIQNNGGILENEIPEMESITQRYWITL